MARVILDTNFLLLPYQEHIDIFTQIPHAVPDRVEFAIIDKTKDELDKLMHEGTVKDRMAARLGNAFIQNLEKQKKLTVIRTFFAKDVDDALRKKAGNKDYVATQDRTLKEELKHLGIKVITLRGNHCVIEHK